MITIGSAVLALLHSTTLVAQSSVDKAIATQLKQRADAMVFNIGVGAGAAALIGGVVLALTAPSAPPKATAFRVESWSGPNFAGARLLGSW